MSAAAVRGARIEDAAAIADLSGRLGYPSGERDTAARLVAVLASPEHTVRVAEVDGRVVGWIHAFEARRIESDPFAEIGGLVVAPTNRRNGVGRVLVDAALDWARRRGLERARVRSRTSRDDAHAFYRALGFATTKEQRVFDRSLAPIANGAPGAGVG